MKKKWWVAPLAIIGALLAEIVLCYAMIIPVFFFTECKGTGRQIFSSILNIIVYIIFSYFIYYKILPHICISADLNYKVISFVLFLLFTAMLVFQYYLTTFDNFPASLMWAWNLNFTNYFIFLGDNLKYKHTLFSDIIFVILLASNFIRPIFFTVSSYKSVKEKEV